MFGCACVVFVHARVSNAREAAIASYGARVVRVGGNYDESVERAAADAQAHDWQVVSDTSYAGYTEVPRDVMSGYTVMVDESIRALPAARPPTHVFVQGGLAGLLALCGDGETARRLNLDEHARVLVFGTEGDTDPELYTEIVGESGDQVRVRGNSRKDETDLR